MENKEEAIGFHYLSPTLALPRILHSHSAPSHGAVNVT
jgi:hypothetical protein